MPSLERRPVGGTRVAAEQARGADILRISDGMLIAVHAIIKKTQKTPTEDLALARQRFKELQSWHGKIRT
jgi:phage-related protein